MCKCKCGAELPMDWYKKECFECLAKPEGCGKFIYHHVGKGNVYCQEEYLCKRCSHFHGKVKE